MVEKIMSVIIENDGLYEEIETTVHDYTKLNNEEIISIINEAGVVGLGGACFPTHVKLSPGSDKN